MVNLPGVFDLRFNAMACSCTVMLAAQHESVAAALGQAAIDEVRRIEHKFSRYRADSVVGRINAAAGKDWVELDEETQGLLYYADSLYRISDGLFDITTGVLRRAWNFSAGAAPGLPTRDDLQPLLALTGWGAVQREGRRMRLPRAGMELDFGGFGKEYAADRAAALLLAQGVRSGYVNLGGDLRVLGPMPDGRPWSIGIQDPRNSGATIASIEVASGALATSGDYERYFILDGQRYCHILDPRNGYPVRHWRSVSVLAPLAVAAGSCSTIAMLKGEAGLHFLKDSGFAFLAVAADGALHRHGVDSRQAS